MVGGVMWRVLSEIQLLELRNTPTTPIRNKLPLNLNVQFRTPIDFGSTPKLGNQHDMVGGVLWWVLSEIQLLELRNTPTTPIRNKLPLNLKCKILYTYSFPIEPKTWASS
ncbi:hypothetical protein ACE6H2_002180 [Prunus campanulata]